MGKAKNDITVNIKCGATTVNIYFIDKFITCHKDDSTIAKIEPQQPRIQPLSRNICTHFIIIYCVAMTLYSTITYHNLMDKVPTLWTDYQGLTLTAHQTTTVYCHTTYCNIVLIICLKASQLTLCDTDIGDVQKSSIWGLGSIGRNVDEVEISTVSTTQCPVHSDIHTSHHYLQ